MPNRLIRQESFVQPMIQCPALRAGLPVLIGCHIFRATGTTTYLEASGSLENAQAMATHESPRTTKLYDCMGDEIMLEEVERIWIWGSHDLSPHNSMPKATRDA